MCGRFASQLSPELLRRIFAVLREIPNTPPSWNVAPTQDAAVVRRHPQTGERRLGALCWGLVPHFTKDLQACKRPINARVETMAGASMFRSAMAERRCLVPADAFTNGRRCQTVGSLTPSPGQTAPLALAGLWESWRDPAGDLLRTFTIATTTANSDMSRLHNRMPVVLEPADWPVWLGEQDGDYAALLRPAPPGTMRLWPVSRAVNNVRNNGPDLLDIADDPHAPLPSDALAGENPA